LQGAPRSRNVRCSDQKVEIAEIAHCRIAVELLRESRSFVREDLDAVMFELPQNPANRAEKRKTRRL
jgi:hypothetical protein